MCSKYEGVRYIQSSTNDDMGFWSDVCERKTVPCSVEHNDNIWYGISDDAIVALLTKVHDFLQTTNIVRI